MTAQRVTDKHNATGQRPVAVVVREGELNRRTTPHDQAALAVLSVKPVSRCLRLAPVLSGPCTPGVRQPVFS